MFEEKLKELEPVFYPKSIAVVGASATSIKAGSLWVHDLRSAGFPGPIYPVASSGGRLEGLDVFTSLRLVPGEVDYVIVAVPRQSVLALLNDCIVKEVKAVQFFGPNCIGVYCPIYKGLAEINDFLIGLRSRQNKPIIVVLPTNLTSILAGSKLSEAVWRA